MNAHYKKLQNGSDIRGISVKGVPNEDVNLSCEEAIRIGGGFIKWLSDKKGKSPKELKIAVGRDPRLSGEMLMAHITWGMGIYGAEVFDCGLASTPAMFMSVIFDEFKCDGAIMITASHLPYNRNGFKFFDADGGLNKGDISVILDNASKDTSELGLVKSEKSPETKKVNLMDTYCKYLRDIIIEKVDCKENREKPLQGLKIVVDAGNGGGGFFASEVLEPLGADASGSQFLEPDGRFPNHAPNPENKQAMESICKKVVEEGADLGLIFDTDVDRASAVDSHGKEISRNGIVALAAALVAEEHPKTTVVTDSITSDRLTDFLENELGLKHKRFMRGYKNVINEAIRLNKEGIDSQLAIETSGHAALKENYFLDDGAYLAVKIVIKVAKLKKEGKSVDSVLANLKHPVEAVEYRLPITAEDFGAVGDRILADLAFWAGMKECAKRTENGEIVAFEGGDCCLCHCGMSLVEPNFEGVRINFDKSNGDGWCLLRKSLHDPIMPLNIESNQEGGCKVIANKLLRFLEAYKDLDTSKM